LAVFATVEESDDKTRRRAKVRRKNVYLRSAFGLLCLCVFAFSATARAEDACIKPRLQTLIDNYLQRRAQPEAISGLALAVDLGEGQPTEVFTGTNGLPDARPMNAATLFQIGSNTKHFTAALILKLEAEGKLDINQTVGEWLPEFPAWRNVRIKSLLNMTSPIPNYSETVQIGHIVAADLDYQFTPSALLTSVYAQNFPIPPPWFYSNTNYILAGQIIGLASGMSYKKALDSMILKPLGLGDTFYSNGAYTGRVLARLPRGIYDNRECLLYQPKHCTVSTLAPLIGKDMRGENMSWAGPAGAIVSNPIDLGRWIRDLFGLRVFPKAQLDEMTTLVSEKTGRPIRDVSAAYPAGFGLGLGRSYNPLAGGRFWFYEGITLGFRAIFAYWPQYDLVITTATNSQPQEGRDRLGPVVVARAFQILRNCGEIPTR
jgi:D-alanyl-D-alanine carboxypeptidase